MWTWGNAFIHTDSNLDGGITNQCQRLPELMSFTGFVQFTVNTRSNCFVGSPNKRLPESTVCGDGCHRKVVSVRGERAYQARLALHDDVSANRANMRTGIILPDGDVRYCVWKPSGKIYAEG